MYIFHKKKGDTQNPATPSTFPLWSPCNGPNHSSPGNSHRNHSILRSPDSGGSPLKLPGCRWIQPDPFTQHPAPFRSLVGRVSSLGTTTWCSSRFASPNASRKMENLGFFCWLVILAQVLTTAMFNENTSKPAKFTRCENCWRCSKHQLSFSRNY